MFFKTIFTELVGIAAKSLLLEFGELSGSSQLQKKIYENEKK